MGETKITKAELKKQETQTKWSFLDKVVEKTYEAILRETAGNMRKLDLRIGMKGHNRYFTFSKYGQTFKVLVYTSGDIDVVLKEICHGDCEKRIFAYTADKDEQNAFIAKYEEILSWAIPGFCDQFDWHAFMDYVDFKEGDFLAAYELYKEEWILHDGDDEGGDAA